jgi:HEPN domain-containing protein
MGNLPESGITPTETLMNFARMLDKYYIPTRYPNGFESGAPTDFYTSEEAQNAIHQAEAIIEFCHHQID